MTDQSEPAVFFSRIWRRWTWRVGIFLVLLALSIAINGIYQRFVPRSVVLEAITGTIEVKLATEMSGQAFENVLVCKRREKRVFAEEGGKFGCLRSAYELIPEKVFTPVFPAGTVLRFRSFPDRLDILVESIPDGFNDADVAALKGGKLILVGRALGALGHIRVHGVPVVGARFANTSDVPLISAEHQFHGESFLGLIVPNSRLTEPKQIIFRRGETVGGAILTIGKGRSVDHRANLLDSGQPARLLLSMTDAEKGLLQMTALSDFAPVDLRVFFERTDPLIIRPNLIDIVLADPVFVLLAMLSAIVSLASVAFGKLGNSPAASTIAQAKPFSAQEPQGTDESHEDTSDVQPSSLDSPDARTEQK